MDYTLNTFEINEDGIFLNGVELKFIKCYKLENEKGEPPTLTISFYIEAPPAVRLIKNGAGCDPAPM